MAMTEKVTKGRIMMLDGSHLFPMEKPLGDCGGNRGGAKEFSGIAGAGSTRTVKRIIAPNIRSLTRREQRHDHPLPPPQTSTHLPDDIKPKSWKFRKKRASCPTCFGSGAPPPPSGAPSSPTTMP